MLEVPFWKLEGCGNSFIVIGGEASVGQLSEFSRCVCDPHFGIGADGLMVVRGRAGDRTLEIDMINPDGSPMGMCGNGIRCVVRYLYLERWAPWGTPSSFQFQVGPRRIECSTGDDGRTVRVVMGRPSLEPDDLPVISPHPIIDEPLGHGGLDLLMTAVSMGNPHCVIFVPELDAIDLAQHGPVLEHHPRFPQRVNVEFAQILSSDCIRVKVWERGAGPTLACGTGACATAVAAVITERAGRSVRVELPGGELKVEWKDNQSDVVMTGPASEICRGLWQQRCR